MAKTAIKTPLGELRWVYIAGDGKDQSMKNDGSKMQKIASIVFKKNSPEAKQLIEQINQAWEQYKAENPKIKPATKPKSLGYKHVIDKDTGAETDEVIFQFKTNSFFPDGKPNIIPVYNAKGQKVDLGNVEIGNGSIGIIFGEAGGWEYTGQFGITLYLKGIQLKKLVEKSSSNLDSQVEDLGEDDEDTFLQPDNGNVPEI